MFFKKQLLNRDVHYALFLTDVVVLSNKLSKMLQREDVSLAEIQMIQSATQAVLRKFRIT